LLICINAPQAWFGRTCKAEACVIPSLEFRAVRSRDIRAILRQFAHGALPARDGETLADIARSYNVSAATISRLQPANL
jgi:hypothetical protein